MLIVCFGSALSSVKCHLILGQEIIVLDEIHGWFFRPIFIIGQESVERCWLPVLVPPCQVLTHLILGQEIIELDDKSVERCWLPVLVPPDPIMQRLHLIPCLSHQYNVE